MIELVQLPISEFAEFVYDRSEVTTIHPVTLEQTEPLRVVDLVGLPDSHSVINLYNNNVTLKPQQEPTTNLKTNNDDLFNDILQNGNDALFANILKGNEDVFNSILKGNDDVFNELLF